MNTLHAPGLVLEPLLQGHAAEMFVVLSDPAIYEFENQPPRSLSALQERYARLEQRLSPDGTQQWLNWVIRLPGGELAGFMQATVIGASRAYVAYELASRFWRRGIASSALEAVLQELALHYGVRDAYALLKAANFRSLGLLAKLGFQLFPAEARPSWQPGSAEITLHKALYPDGNAAWPVPVGEHS